MKNALLGMATLVAAAALLVACGGNDDSNGATGGADSTGATGPGEAVVVESIDFGYEPETLEATAGQAMTIDFRNEGDAPHTFTIDGLVDSGIVAAGESVNLTFTPGQGDTLQFYCTIHGAASMSGELRIR